MGFHIGPRVVKATGGSIHRAGNFRVHHYPDQHVTDGLICHLDPGDPRSFRPANKSGSDWFDLSGNGNDATWNGNVYDYQNTAGGCFKYGNGSSNYYAGVPIGGISATITNEVSVEFWLKETGTNTGSYRCPLMCTQSNNWSNGFGFYIVSGYLGWFVNDYDGDNSIGDTVENQGQNAAARAYYTAPAANSQWTHIMGTYDGIEARLYYNGVYVPTTGSANRQQRQAETINFGTTDQLDIGHANGSYQLWNSGNSGAPEMGVIRVYNRGLCPTEVAQNYNAEKVRYGTTAYTDTFVPSCTGQGGKVELLAVAGGGGGAHGTDNGNGVGGGGAGGLVHNNSFTVVSDASISVTVGSGGTGGAASDTGPAFSGGNTVFGSITAIGGGKGGTAGGGTQIRDASTGGSGGGGGFSSNSTSGQAGTAGQGNAGGDFHNASNFYRGGGGGGAGSAGKDGTADATTGGAHGGDGLAFDISGEKKFYAGGGGGASHSGYSGTGGIGGTGGSGVGGDAANGDGTSAVADIGNNAVPNTGSGGGASTWPGSGGAERVGGSGSNGTVIVRYPAEDYNIEVLVVAGGGGGGYGKISDGGGGGGGGGGVLFESNLRLTSGKNYKVFVAAGGLGSRLTNGTRHGMNGRNSVFGDIIALGGGGGGSTRDTRATHAGGSGGGAGSDAAPNTGGSGTPGQGFAGGGNTTGGVGAGGGGAGEVGVSVTATENVPNGGDGLAFSITGSSVTYAGGGGGGKYSTGSGNAGSGGAGGGAAGGKGAGGSPATNELGGGGGGGGMISGVTGAPGGNGGSGIVIIAYKGPQRGTGGTVSTTTRPGYTIHRFHTVGSDVFIA